MTDPRSEFGRMRSELARAHSIINKLVRIIEDDLKPGTMLPPLRRRERIAALNVKNSLPINKEKVTP